MIAGVTIIKQGNRRYIVGKGNKMNGTHPLCSIECPTFWAMKITVDLDLVVIYRQSLDGNLVEKVIAKEGDI